MPSMPVASSAYASMNAAMRCAIVMLSTGRTEDARRTSRRGGTRIVFCFPFLNSLSSASPAAKPAPAEVNLPFRVDSAMKDGTFEVTIQGRMDTITAPELLKRFQEAGSGIQGIRVDVSRMPYVSSAGLRALLMMYKSLENKDRFEMTGVSDEVREILETTGFDQFLLKA